MPKIGTLHVWADEEILEPEDLNGNDDEIKTSVNSFGAWVDSACTITAAWTFNTSPTFAAAVTFSLGATITAGGVTITAGGLTVTAGGITVAAGTSALQAVTVATTLGVTGATTLDDVTVGGQANGAYFNIGDSGATPAINWANGNDQRIRLTANATATVTNPKVGATYFLYVVQDGTGSRTLTLSGATLRVDGTLGSVTLTTTANRTDIVWYKCVDATGAGTYVTGLLAGNINSTF